MERLRDALLAILLLLVGVLVGRSSQPAVTPMQPMSAATIAENHHSRCMNAVNSLPRVMQLLLRAALRPR